MRYQLAMRDRFFNHNILILKLILQIIISKGYEILLKMEKPLQQIRDLKQSLSQINSQIYNINKDRLRDFHRIDKMIQNAIPKIKHKIIDSNFIETKNRAKCFQITNLYERTKLVKQNRKCQDLKIQQSKEAIRENRLVKGDQLRAKTRLNEQRIKEMKIKVIEEKKMKTKHIKQNQELSKKKVQNFHLKKKEDLKERKELQKFKAEQQLKQLVNDFEKQQLEKSRANNYRQISATQYHKVKGAVLRLKRMGLKQFQGIHRQAQIIGKDVDFCQAENFLQTVAKKQNVNL